MDNLGEKYRELRKSQGVTLINAATNICSASNLSRWENGKIKLNFKTVVMLLDKIHIDTNEFLNYSNFTMDNQIPNDVMQAITSKNTAEIKKLTSIYLDIYRKSNNVYHLYLVTILSNKYLLLTEQNIFPLKAQIRLCNYLSNVTSWSLFNLSILGNSVLLIKPKQIYALSMQIINNFDFEENDQVLTGLVTALSTLSDAIISLIMRNDLLHAQKLIFKVQNIAIPNYLSFFNLTFSFLGKLVQYIKNNDDKPILRFIDDTLNLGMVSSANTFTKILRQISNSRVK